MTPQGMETFIADCVYEKCNDQWHIARDQAECIKRGVKMEQGLTANVQMHTADIEARMDALNAFDSHGELYDVDPAVFEKLKAKLPAFVQDMQPQLEQAWQKEIDRQAARSKEIVNEYGDSPGGGPSMMPSDTRGVEPGE